jgi:hypothetical protein
MKTETRSKKINDIVKKARAYYYKRNTQKSWIEIAESKTMMKYRRQFNEEAEKINYAYTFADCLV